jgi:Tfp pilus assembly protein PilV
VTATAVIDPRSSRFDRLAAKLRGEEGVGIVELLIAVLVLNIGIFATIGAFTSAATTIRSASRISTAAAIADQTVESLHNVKYSNIVNQAATNTTGADGRTYNVQIAVSSGQVTGGSANLKQAVVTVRDGAAGAGGKLLVTSTTTIARCTQSGVQSDSGQAPCYS